MKQRIKQIAQNAQHLNTSGVTVSIELSEAEANQLVTDLANTGGFGAVGAFVVEPITGGLIAKQGKVRLKCVWSRIV